jgi:serine protease Do
MVFAAGRLALKKIFVAAAAAMLLAGPPGGIAPVAAQDFSGPAPVAELAEGLLDAVVNISITQKVKNESDEGTPLGEVPDGAPFSEEFDDFFKGGEEDGSTARKMSSLGSGFVFDPAGYIVTNNHVIEGGDLIEVIFADGSKLKAKLVGVDTKTDLAVLKVEPKKPLKAVPFGDSRKMRIGDWVMAIGNPFGLGGSVSLGIISARNRNINAGPYDNFIQTDAAINRGNSGGPLFNMKGEVIGVNTAIISPSGGSIGIGFAVPTEIAENVVRQIKAFGETRRGWLGVRIQPVAEDMVAELKLDKARGALVSGIIEGGPARNGTLRIGDVVLSFNGQDVLEMRDLPRIVAESPIGVPLAARILRDGKMLDVTMTLERAKDDAEDKAEPPAVTGDQPSDEGAAPEDAPDDKPAQPSQEDKDAAAPPADETLGLTLGALDEARRKEFSIAPDVEGVVILDVKAGSEAAAKGLAKGDVIVEVAQSFVKSPEDVADKITELKESDRRNAYMMIANGKGDLRLVAVPID